MSNDVFEMLLRRWIKKLEGRRDMPYWDDTGAPAGVMRGNACLTIGIGHNLASPMSQRLVDLIFDYDYSVVISEMLKTNAFRWMEGWPENVQAVIIDMAFNMGLTRLLKFKRMIGYMKQGRWHMASIELKDSRYWRTCPNARAERNRVALASNKFPWDVK